MHRGYFVDTPDGLTPRPHACGPWSDQMLHGRLLGGLAARAIEGEVGDPDFQASRLTVDLFRAAALEPVTVTTTVVRDGRRIRVADAEMTCGGHRVARASAVLLRRGEAPPGAVWQPPAWRLAHPSTLAAPERPGLDAELWEMRWQDEAFGTNERSRVWTRELGQLVEGEDLSPFVRAAMSADLASPLANAGDDGLHYINADYSLSMARDPNGEWIGLEALQHQAAAGVALGACTLYDLDGPFATSTTTALANPPLRPEG